jgi:hypothetical protein
MVTTPKALTAENFGNALAVSTDCELLRIT